MRNYIILNGQNSNEISGLLIQSLPPITKPLIRTEIQEIDGRDGDIVTPLGYSSYNKEFTIGLYGDFDVNEVISYFNSEGSVIFSNEPDKYYNYQILEQIDFEKLIRFKTATVKMHCQPFKYAAFEGDYILDPSAPNLLSIPNFTKTTNGLTLTASDGIVTVNGTATIATEFYLPITSLALTAGTYMLSANSSGTNPTNCSVRLIGSTPSNADSLGGKYITLDEGTVTLQGALSSAKTFNYLWFYINPGQIDFTATFEVENQAQKVVSGEGSSLALVGTSEALFSKFDIKGDTYQQTYSGKNLFDVPYSGSNHDVEFTNNRDGSFNISGLASARTNFTKQYNTGVTLTEGVSVDFTISSNKLLPTGVNVYLVGYTNSSYLQDLIQLTGGSGLYNRTQTRTIGAGLTRFQAIVRVENGTSVDLSDVVIQVEISSTATSYQPYVGGIPAPNPDYPQEILTVKHQIMLRLTGKNLANVDELYLPAGVVRTEDGLKDTIESSTLTTYFTTSTVNPVGVYTISFDAKIENPDEAVCILDSVASIWGQNNLTLKNADGEVANEDDRMLTEEWKRLNFTVVAATSEVWTLERAMTLYFSTYTNSPVFVLRNLQIEYGITATDFDKSDSQIYPIDFRTGKNMLSVDFLAMGGLTDGNPDTSIKYRVQNSYAPLGAMPNTPYTISAVLGSTVKGMMVQVQECDANTLFLRSSDWQQLAGGAYTFTTGSDTQMMKLVFALSTTSSTVTEGSTEDTTEFNSPVAWLRGATIQVEAGNTATTYEDYESMELCKIGDYQDYISKSGDNWYVHKETLKYIYSGGGQTAYFDLSIPRARFISPNNINRSPDTKCTSLIYGNTETKNNTFSFSSTSTFVRANEKMSSSSAWDTWVSQNPITFYYALATPTDTQITSPSAIAYLENLIHHVHAYKDMTYISSLLAAPSILPPIVSVEVGKSSDGVVTNSGNFPAKPKLTIYGSGDIGVSLNDNQIFQIALGDEGYITIDTALMEAYQDSTENLKNRLVVGNYDNFILNPGENSITFTGTVTKCIVENYSRWL